MRRPSYANECDDESGDDELMPAGCEKLDDEVDHDRLRHRREGMMEMRGGDDEGAPSVTTRTATNAAAEFLPRATVLAPSSCW